MTPEQLRKLARIKNYRTRYEVIMSSGVDRRLVVYMSGRSFRQLLCAIQDRIENIKAVAGADVWVNSRKFTAGDWAIEFSGRTQREAILAGEYPFIGKAAA
jgi:hypothetical protein